LGLPFLLWNQRIPSLSVNEVMFYVLNSPIEIFPILTNELGCIDLAMDESSFHVMWVFGLEM
jgi:hypothetical protein